MAVTISELFLKLNSRGVEQGSTRSKDALRRMQNQAVRTQGSMASLGRVMTNIFAIIGATRAVRKWIGVIARQEQAEKSLAQALRVRGELTKENMRLLTRQATALQRVTTQGDEATLEMMAMARSLGIATKDLGAATEAALNFSAATGTDAKSAMRAFAQAAQGNINMLGRYVLELRTVNKEELDFAKVLEIVNKGMGGQARIMRFTLGGAIDSLKNSVGDLFEKLGESAGSELATSLNKLTGWIDKLADNLPFIHKFWAQAILAARFAGKQIWQVFVFIGANVKRFFADIIADIMRVIAIAAEKMSIVVGRIKGFGGAVLPLQDIGKGFRLLASETSEGAPGMSSARLKKNIATINNEWTAAVNALNRKYINLKDNIAATNNETEKTAEKVSTLGNAVGNFGTTVASSFASAIVNGEQLGGVLTNLANQFSQMLLNRAFMAIFTPAMPGPPLPGGVPTPGGPPGTPSLTKGGSSMIVNIAAADSQDVYRAVTKESGIMQGALLEMQRSNPFE